MSVIEQTYRSLLADVASLSGFSIIRGSRYDLHWCLNEAPKLEKHLLKHVEHGESLDLNLFPQELRQLARGSVEDPQLMRLIRQLLLFCYKAYVQYDKPTELKALTSFVSTNEQVKQTGISFSNSSPLLLGSVRRHVHSVLYKMRFRDIIPSHGPGASTTPKERWTKWYDQIEAVFPYSDYMCLYYNQDHLSELGPITDEHIKAKIVAVPKDSRGPRLICVHPAESIWIQQGLRCELERAIEAPREFGSAWPRGHVRFDDQRPNGRIALCSSRSRKYATLDMKEASDRLSETLIQTLFGRHYKWFGCCRAQKFVVTDPSFVGYDDNLYCYAPMGNATTFPVQSLVFWAICCASMQSRGFHQPNSVFVFGDDIIVPTSQAQAVMLDLESFGLQVNRDKTFINSQFRESCGVDAFKGVNVTPVRWKCSENAEHTSELLSLSDLAMRLRIAGYENAAVTAYYHLKSKLLRRGMRLFFTNNRNHGSIAEYSERASLAFQDAYWHRDLQKFVSPVVQLKCVQPKAVLRGWNHVLESLTSLRRTRHSNVPDRTVSRRSVLTRGWTDIM